VIIVAIIGLASRSFSTDYWPTHGWRATTPEVQGMDSGILADMVKTIRDEALNVDSITIVRNGYMVMDNYFYPFTENTKHSLRSASKSVMSIGMRSLEFAHKHLFAPLGIRDAHWETNPQGIDYGYDQLLLTPATWLKSAGST
jgi:CubicO group peptidase (beta-lactamase class C family)